MALIKCPECTKEISDKATTCPFCGCPSSFFASEMKKTESDSQSQTKKEKGKHGETLQVEINNRTLIYDNDVIEFSKLNKLFLSRSSQVRNSFIEFYLQNVHSFDDIVNKLPNVLAKIEADAYKFVVDVFMEYGIDYITVSQVKEKAEEYVDFESILSPYLIEWDNIETARMQIERRRSIERSSRGRWSGGGFGVKGAIKGAVNAGMMNAATGVFRGIGDSITDSSDRKKISEMKRNIFAAPETFPNITQELYGNLMSLCDYAYDVLVDDEDISEWNYEIDKLDGRLENYCSSYKKNPSEKECLVEALIDCIEEYPFDISYYVSLYNLDATPYSKIKELVSLWGLDSELEYELKPIRMEIMEEIQDMSEDSLKAINKKISSYKKAKKKDSDIDIKGEVSRLEEKKNYFLEGEKVVSNVKNGEKQKTGISIADIDAALEKKEFDVIWKEAEKGNGYAEWKLENYYSSLISKEMDAGYYSSVQTKLNDVKAKMAEGNKFAEYLCAYFDYKYYSTNWRNVSKAESMAQKIKAFADEGCISAIDMVGWWYQHGYNDMPTSPEKAVECYKKAVNQNHVQALCHLGLCYRYGKGVTADLATAEKLLEKSSQWGSSYATRELGKLRGGSSSSDGCYITTAVCAWQGKTDDCYELTQFRRFRDLWLLYEPDGKAIIEEYYSIAPLIVQYIESNDEKADIYRNIFDKYLSKCLKRIEDNDYQGCKQKYIEMVNELKHMFLL